MKAKIFTLSLAFFLLLSLLVVGAQRGAARAQDKTYTNSIGLEFVLIPAGQFTNAWTTKNDFDEDVRHQRVVTISKPFYLGKYEVTQEQWVAVMGEGSNPSFDKGRTNPVDMVSWNDVQKFIQKLNAEERGKSYRLPTEAEWEHAARAGSETEWFFGNDPAALGQYAWFGKAIREGTYPVGQMNPNPWGLYDIYGNVWEWVQDWYGEYQAGEVTDPTGPASGAGRVMRGGSYYNFAEHCRSANRNDRAPGTRSDRIGFRLALSPGQ